MGLVGGKNYWNEEVKIYCSSVDYDQKVISSVPNEISTVSVSTVANQASSWYNAYMNQ